MTEIRLVTNSVSPNQVRETDEAFIIEDVPFVKPMELAGGYVPRDNIEQTANGWHGVPATLYHVRNSEGEPIPAHNQPDKHIGEVTSPHFDGEHVRAGELIIQKADLSQHGGPAEQIRTALESGEPIEVSSQYAASPLPPGEYDGEFRSNAERIVRPDSVAILPVGTGRCSIEDGCGINPELVANAAVTVPMTDDPKPDGEDLGPNGDDTVQANQDLALTSVGPGDIDSYTDEEWDGSSVSASLPNPSDDEDAPSVLDATHLVHPTEEARQSKSNWKLPFRSGPDAPVNTRALVAIDAALSGARGGVSGVSGDLAESASSRVQSFLEDAPDDLFGVGANSALERLVNAAAALWPGQNRQPTTGAESPADTDRTQPTMEDSDKIDYIVANSEFDRESVSQWEGKQCLDTLFQQVRANTEDGGGDGTEEQPSGAEEQPSENELDVDELLDEMEQRFEDKFVTADEIEEAVTASKQAEQKEEIATEIAANSSEYDDTEAVLDDFPTVASLESKREQVTEPSGVPGTGISANLGNDENGDLDDIPSGVV